MLLLAQAPSPTPAAPAPDEGPPPPSIVERIDASAPIPAATPSLTPAALPTAVPIVAPVPAAPSPTSTPVPVPAPTARPAAAPKRAEAAARGGTFGVHVSSFRRRATAEADARRLGTELALPARVLEADLGAKGVWYRVVVGEAGSAAEASALRMRLAERGIRDTIVVSVGGDGRVR